MIAGTDSGVLTLDFRQGFLQHLHVEVKADGFHLAALLHAEEIAHSTDLHIPHGELVSTAQLGELLNGAQPLTGGVAQRCVARIEQPGMGLNPTATDPSPQLVQLGQAKTVGVLNQDRVDTRNVQAAFHNRGA